MLAQVSCTNYLCMFCEQQATIYCFKCCRCVIIRFIHTDAHTYIQNTSTLEDGFVVPSDHLIRYSHLPSFLLHLQYDPGYVSRKKRKFQADKFDT